MHAAVVIIDGRSRILFAGDSYDGKTTPHNKAIETNRGDFSRHRAGPDRRPCDRGSGGAVYHPCAYAVRLEGGAARGVRFRREPDADTTRTVRCKARRRASRCRKPRNPRRRTPRQARPIRRRSRACWKNRRSSKCRRPNGSANGTAVAPKPAQDNGKARPPHRRKNRKAASAPAATAAGSAPKSGSSTTAANAKPGSGAAPAPGDANTGYFLQVGAVQDLGRRRAAARASRLPGLRIEGHAARCGRRDVLPRAYRTVLEVRRHEFEPSASVRRGRGYRCDPLYETISQQ